jgi:hypothetical protein
MRRWSMARIIVSTSVVISIHLLVPPSCMYWGGWGGSIVVICPNQPPCFGEWQQS